MKEVLCINKEGWWHLETGEPFDFGPKYNEVCIVVRENEELYGLQGYDPETNGYHKDYFVDILSTSTVNELMESSVLQENN